MRSLALSLVLATAALPARAAAETSVPEGRGAAGRAKAGSGGSSQSADAAGAAGAGGAENRGPGGIRGAAGAEDRGPGGIRGAAGAGGAEDRGPGGIRGAAGAGAPQDGAGGDGAGAAGKAPPDTTAPASDATLLMGDSLMKVGLGPVLRRALEKQLGGAVTMQAKSSTGLARPDVYDWGAVVDRVTAGRRFARAVVFLGANDCQTLAGAGDGLGAAFGTPAWEKGYRSRVKALLDKLCDASAEVLWLGPPPMRAGRFDGRVTALGAIAQAEVEASRCGRFLPTRALLADGHGRYAAYHKVVRRRLRIREDDGIHLTQSGGQLLTDAILAELRTGGGASPGGLRPSPTKAVPPAPP